MNPVQAEKLTIALTKGRILTETLPLFAEAGIEPLESIDKSRKLIFETTDPGVSLVLLRGSDVPTYVRHGAADVGVVGKDLLMEFGDEGFYEVLDLGIARCRLMTAGSGHDRRPASAKMRVATKFVNVARAHYSARGIQANIIKLYGIHGGNPKTSYVDFQNGYFLLIDVLEDTLTRRLMKMRRIAQEKKRNGK